MRKSKKAHVHQTNMKALIKNLEDAANKTPATLSKTPVDTNSLLIVLAYLKELQSVVQSDSADPAKAKEAFKL